MVTGLGSIDAVLLGKMMPDYWLEDASATREWIARERAAAVGSSMLGVVLVLVVATLLGAFFAP